MSSPFLCVTSPTDDQTHLLLHTPAMPGHRPQELPHATLCGVATSEPYPSGPGEVECPTCLRSPPTFMTLPGIWVIR